MNVSRLRSLRSILAVGALSVLVAAPVLAGGGKSAAPGQNKEKVEKTAITISGTIEAATGDKGRKTYTLADGGKTYKLEAGPHWFFAEGAYPLDKYVGESVTVEGEIAAGSDEVDVISVNGTPLREPGKPPWAGGWKVVGAKHPGWSQEKADRFESKFGDCWPPGHCKDKSKPDKGEKPDDPDETGGAKETEEPDETEAPDVTAAPQVTEAPALTQAPGTTGAPDLTDAPGDTTAPGDTSAPSDTAGPTG